MPDEINEPPLDWGSIRESQVNFAEMVFTYFQALCNAGFTTDQALGLTLAYQAGILAK